MSYTTFDLVYRAGATSGSHVSRFFLADNFVDLPAAFHGDIGYSKGDGALYGYNYNGWTPVFNGGTIINDLTINKNNPIIKLDNSNLSKARVFTQPNDKSLSLSYNTYNTGGGWVRDDNSIGGSLLHILPDSIQFYFHTENLALQANIAYNGNMRIAGAFQEYSRPQPQGTWINVPYNSGDFFSNGGSWSVSSDDIYQNNYTLIGKTCIWNVSLEHTSTSSAAEIKIRLPITARNVSRQQAIVYLTVNGVDKFGIAVIYPHDINVIYIYQGWGGAFGSVSNLNLLFQMQFEIQ